MQNAFIATFQEARMCPDCGKPMTECNCQDEVKEAGGNKEGMTWPEWARAAGTPVSLPSIASGKLSGKLEDEYKRMRAAWKRGEDPTEHRK